MNRDELEALVIAKLAKAAPGTEPETLGKDEPYRDALDLDSMDFLKFVGLLHEAVGVDVPEADYAQIQTIRLCTDYLAARVR